MKIKTITVMVLSIMFCSVYAEKLPLSSTETSAVDGDGWSFDDSPLYEDDSENFPDPLEPFNRLMFKVNDALDKVLLIPLSMAYKHVLPNFLQVGVSNFASNFFSPVTLVNFMLQGDSEHVVKTVFRFMINTVFGFFGTVDVAAKMGLEKKNTSLGDTFKKWGMNSGPYLVLPILGSGSMRTGFSRILQLPMDPLSQVTLSHWKKSTRQRIYYYVYGADIISKRASLLDITRELEATSDDMYVTTRNALMSMEG